MISRQDTLTSKNVRHLLHDKYILILGDSVIRGLYKDMIKYSHSNDILHEDELRIKGETRFYGDRLIHGGIQKGLTNGVDYEEIREYTAGGLCRIRFYFLTRSYSTYLKEIVFNDIKNQVIKPDIIIMNSSLWDLSRYGIESMKSYEENVDYIIGLFNQMFPNAVFLWLSALPVSNSSKDLIHDGNYYCSQICHRHNALYIDLHTSFSSMLHLRQSDGIHWSPIATRMMNEIIFNHLKAYYNGVNEFKCSVLREELGNKIKRFKQRINKSKTSEKKISLNHDLSYDDSGIIDMEFSPDEKRSFKIKQKQNDQTDDEKENNHKIRIISSTVTNEQRMIIEKKTSDYYNEKDIQSMKNQFDHQYCDMMYDNEFEGLYLSHFSGYDLQTVEDIENESMKQPSSMLSLISNEKNTSSEPDYIILSSDDDDDEEMNIHGDLSSLSSSVILPVYLLNHF